MADIISDCCEKNRKLKLVIYFRRNVLKPSDVDGWVIGLYAWGDVHYENIDFCPFCGKKLKDMNYAKDLSY